MALHKNIMSLNAWGLLAIILMLIAPLAYSADKAQNTQNVSITIEKPFVRSTPPGQKVAGAFMRLTNNTAKNIDLIAASSPVAEVTEIHETRMKDGVMRMQHIGKIAIPANGSTELKPGGFHVMLINLNQQLMPDDSIKITLQFSDQSTQTIAVPVVKIAGETHHHHH